MSNADHRADYEASQAAPVPEMPECERSVAGTIAGIELTYADVYRILAGAPLRDVERGVVLATLESCGGRKRKAARTLGITSRTLRYKLRQYRKELDTDEASGMTAETSHVGHERDKKANA